MSNIFYIPSSNLMGPGCLADAVKEIAAYGFKNALIVTDKILNQLGVAGKVTELLEQQSVSSVIFDETKPNPTVENVESGLKVLKSNQCDCVISLGGGSPHDCAEGIEKGRKKRKG